MSERWRSLFGHPDGRWMLLEGAVGSVMSPPNIGDLVYIGSADSAVTKIYNRITAEPRSEPIQMRLAERLGVGQQAVSRYIAGTSYPDLPDHGWSALVEMWFEAVESDD